MCDESRTEETGTVFGTYLTVIGTLITNVNRRRLTDGTTVVNFRVASNERRFDRASGTWTDGDTLYVSVTCWRQLAENVHRTFNVGDPIIVQGRLYTRNYEDKEGRRQSVTELEGLAVGPDLTRASAVVTRLRRDGTPAGASPRASGAEAEQDRAEDESGDRSYDGEERRELPRTAESDDPWQVTAGELDSPTGDRDGPGASHGAPAEAAVVA
jgi:single-strand DNA-binding protein